MNDDSQHVKWCAPCRTTFDVDVRFCGICGQELSVRTITEPIADVVGPEGGSSYLGQTIDRYLIKRLVGRGGMGTVYEVEHTLMKRRLAMKLLHEDMVVRKQLVSRFTREARAVSRLNSAHTVTVHDFGRHEALFFLVMEFLDGEDLEVVLSREGALPWRRAFKILAQVCESLEEAHGAGIVHRDLKPENIMVLFEPKGEDFIKVLDFGLAKISGGEDLFSVHSHRDLFGTPFYMSPEQIRAEEIDHRADIYSLGCLAFRVLVNQHVYDAPYAFDVLRQHLTSPIPSVRRSMPHADIPERVDRLVLRALAKDRENRFPDVAAMRREILDCLAHPEGVSRALPSIIVSDAPAVIDDELEARLQAFEESHQEAEARMHGEAGDLPYAEVIEEDEDDGEFMPLVEPPDVGVPLSDAVLAPEARGPDHPMNVVTTQIPLESRRRSTSPQMVPFTSRAAEPVDDPDDELSDPSEEGRLFRRIRRRRRVRGALLVALVAVAAVGTWWAFNRPSERSEGLEAEPNNTVANANVLRPEVEISGTLGPRVSQFQGDRDAYRLPMRGAGQLISVEVGPLKGVDLSVDVLSDGRRIARLNHSGIGQKETIHNLLVPADEAVIVVSEHHAGNTEPVENTEPYTLKASILGLPSDGVEVEPNDVGAAANPYTPGAKVLGQLDGPGDVDVYQITTPRAERLQRWEIVLESKDRLVPRIELYRMLDDSPVLVYADEGREGLLRTVYEEPAPNESYLLFVAHAGRGIERGRYSLLADLTHRKSRIAHEPNDDRARATTVEIGERVHGALEGSTDQDVFSVRVTDPRYREIEIDMEPVTRSRVRLVITDVNKGHVAEFPRRVAEDAAPQPQRSDRRPIRFSGIGETYYVTVRHREPDTAANAGYSFSVKRLVSNRTGEPVGGPSGY